MWHVTRNLRFLHPDSLSIAFGGTANDVSGRNYANCMLAMTFSLYIASPLSRLPLPRPYSLSIENVPSDCVSTNVGFSEILQNIRRLEVRAITLQNRATYSDTTLSFHDRLPRLWLVPASQTLTVLHLSADAPWGWYPKIDLRGIHFPHLKDLMLSRFTFSHDWQMEWLSNHAGSLKHLSLTECAILDHAASTRQYFDSEGYPPSREPSGGGTAVKGFYSYQRRWSYYFEGFAKFLPNLQSFSLFGPGLEIGDTYHPDVLDEKMIRLSRDHHRYLWYTSVSYTPLFNESGGSSQFGSHQRKQDEEDPRALRELLTVIRQRNRTRI